MDIKEKIAVLVNKAKSNKNFRSEFISNPVRTIETEFGVKLPDEQINAIVSGVKAKLTADKAGGLFDKAKKLF